MNSNYEIFKQRSDGSFVRIEAVKDIDQARRDLKNLVSTVPGDYRLWDSSRHKFINPSKHEKRKIE
jgi:hypothetical protein